MPELPDLDIVADALHAALAGRPVVDARALMPLSLRGTPPELAALVGQRLSSVRRVGKYLDLQFSADRVVVNPMLTGRFQLARGDTRAPTGVALELHLGARQGRGPADTAAWTRGRSWLPAGSADPWLRYRDPTQMGKVYLLPAGTARVVPGRGPGELGPDALDPALTPEVWRERIRRHPGELKNLLRNQSFVAGIGNAYADEILFAARLAPFRKRSTLAPDEVDALYAAMRATLLSAVEVLRLRVPPTFERQVRDHLAVHGKGDGPCPRCGGRLTQVSAGRFPTGYCRTCQR